MQIKSSGYGLIATGISVACAAIAVTSQTSAQLTSSRSQEVRTRNLTTIAQHVISQSCWELSGGKLMVGNEIELNGQSPTSCFYNPQTNQYGFAAYLNGQLQITHVFSQKEVDAQKSTVLKGGKDG